jgi:arabinose-5-phosphate isomerase
MKQKKPSALGRALKVFDIEIAALRRVRKLQGKGLVQAVDMMVECLNHRGKVVVSGIGKSGLIGRKIAATLTSTGASSVILDATNAVHGDLGMINDGDVLLLLSNSGETEELVRILPMLKRFDVKMISIVGRTHSTLAKHSDVVLSAHVTREACPHNLAPTASTTAMLVLGDALAMAVLEARGFRKEDFAKFHPGGALGQALLLPVDDVMRVPPRFALVLPDATVQLALHAMSRARSGCVAVQDREGKLVGVFTHGDFARHYASNHEIGSIEVKKVMTRNPIYVRSGALAATAVQILKEHQIDDLVVVDSKNRPLGLIDSQDLPKHRLV